MADPYKQIEEFIQLAQSKGLSDAQLSSQLTAKGWKQKEIDQAFIKLSQQPLDPLLEVKPPKPPLAAQFLFALAIIPLLGIPLLIPALFLWLFISPLVFGIELAEIILSILLVILIYKIRSRNKKALIILSCLSVVCSITWFYLLNNPPVDANNFDFYRVWSMNFLVEFVIILPFLVILWAFNRHEYK